MKRYASTLLTATLILMVVAESALAKSLKEQVLERTNRIEPIELALGEATMKGAPDARVTIIEYSDYQCRYCAKHANKTLPQITARYIDGGQVRYVVREFVIPNFHPRSAAASLAALCAGDQDKYWELHDKIFENQTELWDEDLRNYASEIGLSPTDFNSCMEQQKHSDQITRDRDEGNEFGVKGTPSFLLGLTDPNDPGKVNVTHFIYGAQDFNYFAEQINRLLENSD